MAIVEAEAMADQDAMIRDRSWSWMRAAVVTALLVMPSRRCLGQCCGLGAC